MGNLQECKQRRADNTPTTSNFTMKRQLRGLILVLVIRYYVVSFSTFVRDYSCWRVVVVVVVVVVMTGEILPHSVTAAAYRSWASPKMCSAFCS